MNILVTGHAGFIGSNLVKRLFKEMQTGRIVGIDNLNDYYDPSLKEYRLAQLAEAVPAGIEYRSVRGDISDRATVEKLFAEYNTPKWRHTQTSFDNAYFLSPEPIKMRGKCFTAPISNKNEIRMKALIDRTSVEIFLEDGSVSFTFCVFPDDEADELSLAADCGMKIKELTVTDMEGIW